MPNNSSKPTFIRADMLQAGDVILFKGSALHSKVISKITKGSYSHASVVVSKLLQFEATDIGLGYTHINLSKVEKQLDNQRRWLWDVSKYEEIDVFRHPEIVYLDNSKEFELTEKLMDILRPLDGLEYPPLESLYNATDFLSVVPNIKKTLLKLVEKIKSKGENKIIPGLFCSALVAHCFTELGYELFNQVTDRDRVNPNNLADPKKCKLQLLENIKCFSDDSLPNDTEFFEVLNIYPVDYTRDISVYPLVKARRVQAMIENLFAGN